MELQHHIQKSLDAFLHHAKDGSITLLHPSSRFRSVLLARLLNKVDIPTYYYAMGPDDVTLHSFIMSIAHNLANQHPTFGRHIHILPQYVHDDFSAHTDLILQTFIHEIEELSEEPFFFILDEYDQADEADDIQRFIEQLANHLPEHCKLVLNSRTLPRLPWIAMLAKHQAVILEDDQLITEDFYGGHQDDSFVLQVNTFGPGYIVQNGEVVEDWEGHLPRLLLFFALDRAVITRSEICDAFWPELEEDQAVNVFHVTKRRLHKALGLDILVHDGQYYRINPEISIYNDALDFVENLMRGRYDKSENAFSIWEKAARLYRGPFLQGHTEDWVLERRRAYLDGYLEILNNMAKIWEAREKAELGLKLYHQGLRADHDSVLCHRELMWLYTRLGRRSEAAEHYQKYLASLKDHKREPASELERAYAEIMET